MKFLKSNDRDIKVLDIDVTVIIVCDMIDGIVN